ncbi:hypothetical protein [Pseudomonas putida]|uniref:Uncharacterized protein n=1 Tax=Pseudomonas putida TaxID=303 RepID=A0A8I1ECZ4_PSEPU|nr:hypothetical protein [Pseudomonas putida]MBI6883082.1 hypothetical protein [Pseudomonas putida]
MPMSHRLRPTGRKSKRATVTVQEDQRRSILRALGEARKLGYFCAFRLKNENTDAREEVIKRGAEKYLYCTKRHGKEGDHMLRIYFYWAGDGAVLSKLFRDQGLTVDWDGNQANSIMILCNKAA